jgi:hypothetical protein
MAKTAMRVGFLAVTGLLAQGAAADPFFFSTGDPDGLVATASRPDGAGKIEIESADDFILGNTTRLDGATFTGLLPTGVAAGSIGNVVVEIYRVFPNDSDVTRTSGAPTFSTPEVPTRVNSPSDVAFDTRDAAGGSLAFSVNVVDATFTANNSVLNGINPKPGQTTGGEGSVTGQEAEFQVTFTTPLVLPADHYFFVPQVELSGAGQNFMWLSAPKPITDGSGPFMPDLQSWIRNANLDPDWLRVGTDIIGAGAFNAAFSLTGATVAEPATLALLVAGLAGFAAARRRRG